MAIERMRERLAGEITPYKGEIVLEIEFKDGRKVCKDIVEYNMLSYEAGFPDNIKSIRAYKSDMRIEHGKSSDGSGYQQMTVPWTLIPVGASEISEFDKMRSNKWEIIQGKIVNP